MSAYWYGEDFSEARLQAARAAADTALRLNPNLSEAHVADGYYWYWGFRAYERGARSFARPVELDNNNLLAILGLGATERRAGRLTEAVETFRRAVELDPRTSSTWRDYSTTLL